MRNFTKDFFDPPQESKDTNNYRTKVIIGLAILGLMVVLGVAFYHIAGNRDVWVLRRGETGSLVCKGSSCASSLKRTRALYLVDSSHIHYSHSPPFGALDSNVKRGSQFFYNGFIILGTLASSNATVVDNKSCFIPPIRVVEQPGPQSPASKTSTSWVDGKTNEAYVSERYGLLDGVLAGEFDLRAEVTQKGRTDEDPLTWMKALYGTCESSKSAPAEEMRGILARNAELEGSSITNVDLNLNFYPSNAEEIGTTDSWSRLSFVYRAHKPFPESWLDVWMQMGGNSGPGGGLWSGEGPAVFAYAGHASYLVSKGEDRPSLRPLGAVHVILLEESMLSHLFPNETPSPRLHNYKSERLGKHF